ncbi:MAG: hypothetical protein GX601_13345, partial [Anaerolineales bacterium]|nr:hypothetical protein [Anaerolineales bacterium]
AGAVYTAQLRYSQGFTETEIVQIEGFYAKVDTHAQNPYGLVPEFSEMNNVAHIPLLRHRVYCPLMLRGFGEP